MSCQGEGALGTCLLDGLRDEGGQARDGLLRRMGLDPGEIVGQEPSLELLSRLSEAQALSIPWETLDTHLGERVALDVARFHDKIVGRGRGGFCYEVTLLLAWLLRALGFGGLELARGWVCRGLGDDGRNTYSPVSCHVVLKVEIARPQSGGASASDVYLLDPGFPEGPATPMLLLQQGELFAGEHRCRLDAYERRFERREEGVVLLRRSVGMVVLGRQNKPGTWETLLRLDDAPGTVAQLRAGLDHVQDSPDMFFNRTCPDHRVMCVATERARRHTLLQDKYVVAPLPATISAETIARASEAFEREGGGAAEAALGVVRTELGGEEAYQGVLRNIFGIRLGEGVRTSIWGEGSS